VVLVQIGIWRLAYDADPRGRQSILGLLGLWWCIAALWVEIKIEQTYPGFQYDKPEDPEMKAYRPFCDFAPWATCSKVLMSPPGRFLRYFGIAKPVQPGDEGIISKLRNLIDVPNPSLGVLFFGCHVFYPVLLIVPVLNAYMAYLFLGACCVVGIMTIWLAYNLFFVLKDFCVVCVSMYVANFAVIQIMNAISQEHRTSLEQFLPLSISGESPFFGSAPFWYVAVMFVLDAVMFVAMIGLFLFGTHNKPHKGATPANSKYESLLA
jgi:vitamin-K-epoxide reductase (warfarin-sensitive)